MTNKKTLIFVGNSGCGKGTQADLLEKKMKSLGEEILHIEIGSQFRNLLSMTTYTAQQAQNVAAQGLLQPEFLAVHLWADTLNLHYSPEKNLILDGTPRTLREASVLDAALKFYGIENPIVIYTNVSRETAEERMLSRGRKDDTKEKIKNRLDWFKRDVMPVIDFFINNDYYQYIEIDGHRSIEEIHQDILSRLDIE